MNRKVVIALALVALAATATTYFFFRETRASPSAAARKYLQAWEESDFPAMEAVLFRKVGDFKSIHEDFAGEIASEGLTLELGEVTEDGPAATARFDVAWKLEGAGDWTYPSSMNLELKEEKWTVDWTPAILHPKLVDVTAVERTRTWPSRGEILASDDRPIAGARKVVIVGIEPRRVTDRAAMIQALVDNLGSDPAKINAALDQPGLRGDWFLPIEELTPERYEQVKPVIYPVPGLVFQSQNKRLPPSPGFAQHVAGTVGPVTKELLDKLGEPYEASDRVGLTGLEGVYEKTLAGKPTIEIAVASNDGEGEVLHKIEGEPAQPVKTTLSIQAQTAAEAALAGIEKPAGIVVVDVATSEIRAVVSRPLGEFNRAMSGKYPPGSSFKIVTGAALLGSGVSVDQNVSCPPEIKIGGKTFKNFEGNALGEVNFRSAFIQSCNTAMIGLSAPLEGKLGETATAFGFNSGYDLPLNAAGGSYPDPKDDTERAASAIGQGRVTASPLHMATVAAAVDGGGWKQPQLLAGQAPAAPTQIDPAVATTLRALMTSVVEEGSGVRAKVPGRAVAGKTGTAEFGQEVPPKTHAWFVGYSGTMAFAIVIEDGGVGGEVAAPVAARLVAGLP